MEYEICIEELNSKVFFELQHVEENGNIKTEFKSESIIEIMQHVETRKLTISDVTFSNWKEKSISIANEKGEELFDKFSSCDYGTLLATENPNKYIVKSFDEAFPDQIILLPENSGYTISEQNDGWPSVLGKHE